MATPPAAWADNLDGELDHWRSALVDPGETGERLRARAERRPVWDLVRSRVPAGADPVRVLDVGSGPLTTMGTEWAGRAVEVVAIDPLAEAYNAMLDEAGIDPPVRAVVMMAEELDERFAEGRFHFVLAANSLDHCADPVRAISAMVRVTAPGGTILLVHHENVGEKENYHGLHQWNLAPEGRTDVRVWSRTAEVMLSALAPRCSVSVEPDAGDVFKAWITRPPS